MPIWKDQKDVATAPPEPTTPKDITRNPPMTADEPMRRATAGTAKESLIAADLTIEGKIEGAGHVRIAGRFKGDIHVQGNLTIEVGAKVTGGVRASTVTIAGELEGNIDAAARVELLETGVLNGDLKAGSLTVAAGSRMRGNMEFGWDERGTGAAKPSFGAERSTAA
jgi:cytoskeletal protein CcmA (bactofilin family)